MIQKELCLVGNPNCGKTTLFNLLTGAYQKVGNWAGVTVDKKQGFLRNDKRVKITDLPGLYSLSPNSPDEAVVTEFLKTFTGVIVNVIDGTSLERSLFLTLSLLRLGLPMVVGINMMDQLKKEKAKLNLGEISKFLGVPVFEISAKRNQNVDKLINTALTLKNSVLATKKENPFISATTSKLHQMIEDRMESFISKTEYSSKTRTEKIDRVLTHELYGTLIFFAVMFFVYAVSLKLGGALGDRLGIGIGKFGELAAKLLVNLGVKYPVVDLLVNAVIKGIGSVLTFLPHLLILFFFMTLLEESGYTARVSLIFDKFFSRLSLSGKSVIPFVLSCGCTVAGIEASKVIENSKERELTVLLASFLPCGAKTAVFGWFSLVFFNGSALIALSLYVISFAVIYLVAKVYTLLKKTEKEPVFILELPVFRTPSIKSVAIVLMNKTKEFLIKSGTVIFAVSIMVWTLTNFGFNGYTNGVSEQSFLYLIGNGIKYLFYPLGFYSWQSSVSLLSGVLAKEAVVETMEILSKYPNELFNNGFSVYAFMVFALLSPPCVASISVAVRELGSVKKVLKMILIELAIAYGVALIINLVGIILSLSIGLILSTIIGIITGIGLLFSLKEIIKAKYCANCVNCRRVNCERKNNVRLYAGSRKS